MSDLGHERINKTKVVVKNTSLLYVRMVFVIVINLYASRIILSTLGIEDFGIYNVVGGVVMMFSFLNTAMSVGTQRFLSYEIGRGGEGLRNIFISSVHVHLFISALIVLFSETLGLWFLEAKMQIPEERVDAAFWVFQSAVFSLVFTVNIVPYNAFVMSREDMGVFAFISMFEALLKFLIIFLLDCFSFDKLKLYACLSLLVAIVVFLAYRIYCQMHYTEARYAFRWNGALFSRLLSYSSWNLFGGFANVCSNYGINVVLNLFFGATVNAARGIAYQVNAAVANFVVNFQSALNPPIVKAYAQGDYDYMQSLVYRGAKYSFFLLYFLCLPLFICAPYVLDLWLVEVPDHAISFTRWALGISLIDSFSGTLMISSQASGRIRTYQLSVALCLISILPLSYLFLDIYHIPEIAFVISLGVSIAALFLRLFIVSKLVPLSISHFIHKVIFPAFSVVLLTPVLPYLFYNRLAPNFLSFVCCCFFCWGLCAAVYWFLGFEKGERAFFRAKIETVILKLKMRNRE